MITVNEALQIIAEEKRDFGSESILLSKAINRVLAEEWFAERDYPPFDRVMMDGIAINYSDYNNEQRVFKIQDIAPAGTPQKSLTTHNGCLEVMTGSVKPKGTDTVIRYEDLKIEDEYANIIEGANVNQFQNIHKQGLDRKAKELLVKPGIKLSSAEIGIGASLGKVRISVRKLPKVIIISTGDELVEINEQPAPHQIRKSNVYRIQSTLNEWGILAETAHLNDNVSEIESKLKALLLDYDVIMLSGGVSKGKYDFVPAVLETLQVRKLFHRVRQKPGKPFWFGNTSSCTVFAFPGNPISSFVCLHKYFKYWLDLCVLGKESTKQFATLASDFSFKPDLTYFLEVRLEYNERGMIMAYPQKGNGSADLANLIRVDAFMELPQEKSNFLKNETYPLLNFR